MKIVDINSIPRKEQAFGQIEANPLYVIKDRQRLYYIISCLIIIIPIATFLWSYYQNKKDIQAQNDVFQAIYHFEAGFFDKALEGDGVHKGFLAIMQEYPYTRTTRLAYLYAGLSYMHQKEYDKAITFLKKFSCKDFIMQARVYAVIGDAYNEQENYKQAAVYYKKAASYKPNSVYTPNYLVKAAISFEAANQYKEAYNCYSIIVEKYPTTRQGKELAIQEASRLAVLVKN